MAPDDLVSTLVQMSIVFANSVDQKQFRLIETDLQRKFPSITLNVIMPYTREEEAWIQNQFKLLEEAYSLVRPEDKFVQNFTSFSQGSPIPAGSLQCLMRCLRDRVWRMFDIHPEFQTLTTHDQTDFVNKNGPSGVILMMARAELAPSGSEQLRVMYKNQHTILTTPNLKHNNYLHVENVLW